MPYDYLAIARGSVDSGLRVVDASSQDYAACCTMCNRALRFEPAWIAYPYSEIEVVEAVSRAVAEKLPIAVRSGGHDYEGFSTNDGGAVIDMSRCDAVRVHGRDRCIVGPGVQLRKLYHTLFSYNGLSLPGGTCGSVGVAGLTLGGGFGNLSRRHGLLCDRLRRVRMVDARGRVWDTDRDGEAADLLWACRGGGGGNFGVVTEFEFEPVSVPLMVTSFSYKWNWSEPAIRALFRAYEAWLPTAPREIGATLVITGKSWNTLHFFGQSLASEEETRAVLSSVTESVSDPTENATATVPFLSEMERYAGNDFASSSWKMASSFSKDAISEEGLAAMIAALSETPGAALIEFDALGGAVAEIDPRATAFPHRDQRLMWQYQTYWANPEEAAACRAWISVAFLAIDPFTSRVSYRNYCDLNLADWQQRYYGANYPRLQQIKGALDPQNVFRYPQSIR